MNLVFNQIAIDIPYQWRKTSCTDLYNMLDVKIYGLATVSLVFIDRSKAAPSTRCLRSTSAMFRAPNQLEIFKKKYKKYKKNNVLQKFHSKIALQAKILDNQHGPTRHRSSSLRGIYSLVFEIQRPCSPARWLAAQHLRTNVPALNVQKMTSTESESNPSHKAPARCKP